MSDSLDWVLKITPPLTNFLFYFYLFFFGVITDISIHRNLNYRVSLQVFKVIKWGQNQNIVYIYI